MNADIKAFTLQTSLQEKSGKASSILSVNVEVLEIWAQVVNTTFDVASEKATPFWMAESPLSKLIRPF